MIGMTPEEAEDEKNHETVALKISSYGYVSIYPSFESLLEHHKLFTKTVKYVCFIKNYCLK
jgi:hypothetical protein